VYVQLKAVLGSGPQPVVFYYLTRPAIAVRVVKSGDDVLGSWDGIEYDETSEEPGELTPVVNVGNKQPMVH
jgi:hypothetical protein